MTGTAVLIVSGIGSSIWRLWLKATTVVNWSFMFMWLITSSRQILLTVKTPNSLKAPLQTSFQSRSASILSPFEWSEHLQVAFYKVSSFTSNNPKSKCLWYKLVSGYKCLITLKLQLCNILIDLVMSSLNLNVT